MNYDDQVNPVEAALEEVGMSKSDLGIAADVSPSTVFIVTKGAATNICPRIIDALHRAGADIDGLEERYFAWRRDRGREIISRCKPQIVAKTSGGGV